MQADYGLVVTAPTAMISGVIVTNCKLAGILVNASSTAETVKITYSKIHTNCE